MECPMMNGKKNIKKNFPNISNELVNLVINFANPDKKFELIQNPKKFLDKEFVKLNDPTELNLSLGRDLPQKDLIKIKNFQKLKKVHLKKGFIING